MIFCGCGISHCTMEFYFFATDFHSAVETIGRGLLQK